MINEQHLCCNVNTGGFFYAQELISGNHFHDNYGYRDGLCDDMLQHCTEHRRNVDFVFLAAFKELAVMGPIAFVLDFFLVGKIAKAKAFKMVDVRKDNPFHLVIAISAVSVIFMCPLMSLAATLLFKDAGGEFVAVWLQTTALNFPMALCWQLFFAGPAVRFVFSLIFREKKSAAAESEEAA